MDRSSGSVAPGLGATAFIHRNGTVNRELIGTQWWLIVATGRETRRIQGEYVWRVPPLEVPASGQRDAAGILGHSAVELFVARARESGADMAASKAVVAAAESGNAFSVCYTIVFGALPFALWTDFILGNT